MGDRSGVSTTKRGSARAQVSACRMEKKKAKPHSIHKKNIHTLVPKGVLLDSAIWLWYQNGSTGIAGLYKGGGWGSGEGSEGLTQPDKGNKLPASGCEHKKCPYRSAEPLALWRQG